MAITPTEGDKVRKLAGLALGLVLMVLGVIAPVSSASAHQGNIKVTNTSCVDGNSMSATYTVGWSNGTSSGKLYTKSGLYSGGTSTSGWDFEKNVSGASGSASFTKTHTFSGSNGPWIAFKIIFDDDYVVGGDTRVEGWNWDKCKPAQPDPKTVTDHEESCKMAMPSGKLGGERDRTGTQDYVWNGSSWVLGDTIKWGDWKYTPYTDSQYFSKCAGDNPGPKYGEWSSWSNEQPTCENTTVTQTRTRTKTTYTWVWNGMKDRGDWVVDEVTEDKETRKVSMSDEEFAKQCKTEQPPAKAHTDSEESCDLKAYGFSGVAGFVTREGLESYKWDLEGRKWVLSGKIEWGDWKVTPYDDATYFTKCAPDKPKDDTEKRDFTDQPNCSALTVTSWKETRSRGYVWDLEGRKWVPGDWSDWAKVPGSETVKDANQSQCEFYIETSHTQVCGAATITLVNHSPWVYPVSYRVDNDAPIGTPDTTGPYGPVVNNTGANPNHQSASKTFTFPEDSGDHVIRYAVRAGTEADLYLGKPVGEVKTITVSTNCRPDVTAPTLTITDQVCTPGDGGLATYKGGSIAVTKPEGVGVVKVYDDEDNLVEPTSLDPGTYTVVAFLADPEGSDWRNVPEGWKLSKDKLTISTVVKVAKADDCTVAPPEPRVEPKVETKLECDGAYRRTWDLVSYPVWKDGEWTFDGVEPKVENETEWKKFRELSNDEWLAAGCRSDQPPAQVRVIHDQGMSCDGLWGRTQTGTTEYVWVWSGMADRGSWVLGDEVLGDWSDWAFIRELTKAEKAELGCNSTPNPPDKPKVPPVDEDDGDGLRAVADPTPLIGLGVLAALGITGAVIAIRRRRDAA